MATYGVITQAPNKDWEFFNPAAKVANPNLLKLLDQLGGQDAM